MHITEPKESKTPCNTKLTTNIGYMLVLHAEKMLIFRKVSMENYPLLASINYSHDYSLHREGPGDVPNQVARELVIG